MNGKFLSLVDAGLLAGLEFVLKLLDHGVRLLQLPSLAGQHAEQSHSHIQQAQGTLEYKVHLNGSSTQTTVHYDMYCIVYTADSSVHTTHYTGYIE